MPILGVPARGALKPIVDAVVRLRKTFTPPRAAAQAEQGLVRLEEEVRRLRAEIRQLAEGQRFARLLTAPADSPGSAPDAPLRS